MKDSFDWYNFENKNLYEEQKLNIMPVQKNISKATNQEQNICKETLSNKDHNGIIECYNESNYVFIITFDTIMLFVFLIIQLFIASLLFTLL
jgi:hypothetical protein